MTNPFDSRQCFTSEQFEQIPKDINLHEELAQPLFQRANYPDSYQPKRAEVYLDERLTFVLENQKITFEIYLPKDFVSQSTLIKLDGFPAYASQNQKLLFDGLEGITI